MHDKYECWNKGIHELNSYARRTIIKLRNVNDQIMRNNYNYHVFDTIENRDYKVLIIVLVEQKLENKAKARVRLMAIIETRIQNDNQVYD